MRALSRRTVHGMLAGAAVAPLAGCDLDGLLPGSGPSTPVVPTADERLVDRVTAAIRSARAVAEGLRAEPLVALHDAHLRALAAPVPASGGPATTGAASTGAAATGPAATTTAGPRALRAAESSLQQTLTDAAGRAESGGLARLLAAMAAAVAQQLVVLRRSAA